MEREEEIVPTRAGVTTEEEDTDVCCTDRPLDVDVDWTERLFMRLEYEALCLYIRNQCIKHIQFNCIICCSSASSSDSILSKKKKKRSNGKNSIQSHPHHTLPFMEIVPFDSPDSRLRFQTHYDSSIHKLTQLFTILYSKQLCPWFYLHREAQEVTQYGLTASEIQIYKNDSNDIPQLCLYSDYIGTSSSMVQIQFQYNDKFNVSRLSKSYPIHRSYYLFWKCIHLLLWHKKYILIDQNHNPQELILSFTTINQCLFYCYTLLDQHQYQHPHIKIKNKN